MYVASSTLNLVHQGTERNFDATLKAENYHSYCIKYGGYKIVPALESSLPGLDALEIEYTARLTEEL
jgi:hypothetical protein